MSTVMLTGTATMDVVLKSNARVNQCLREICELRGDLAAVLRVGQMSHGDLVGLRTFIRGKFKAFHIIFHADIVKHNVLYLEELTLLKVYASRPKLEKVLAYSIEDDPEE
jgi:hypothetical protein